MIINLISELKIIVLAMLVHTASMIVFSDLHNKLAIHIGMFKSSHLFK